RACDIVHSQNASQCRIGPEHARIERCSESGKAIAGYVHVHPGRLAETDHRPAIGIGGAGAPELEISSGTSGTVERRQHGPARWIRIESRVDGVNLVDVAHGGEMRPGAADVSSRHGQPLAERLLYAETPLLNIRVLRLGGNRGDVNRKCDRAG